MLILPDVFSKFVNFSLFSFPALIKCLLGGILYLEVRNMKGRRDVAGDLKACQSTDNHTLAL